MDRSLLSRSKRVREGFGVQLLGDPYSGNRVSACRLWISLRKRVGQGPLRCFDFEGLPSIIDRDCPNLHSCPLCSRSPMRSRSFFDAAPLIGFSLSKSYFTTSLPFGTRGRPRWMVALPRYEDVTTAPALAHR